MPNFEHTRRTVLKTAVGAVAAAGGLTVLAGSAAAHFPQELSIDIRPGNERNPVNPRSNGVVSVAVLQTVDFDPTAEDVRYRFGAPDVVAAGGGAPPVHSTVRDVDGDGRDDLVLQFRTNETGFDDDDTEGELRWDRDESREHGLSGVDDIAIVGHR